MLRIRVLFTAVVLMVLAGTTHARAAEAYVKTDIPAKIAACLEGNLQDLFDVSRTDRKALFDFFLDKIDYDLFGRYNYKRAWIDWGRNAEIKRLAVYEYFALMAGKRGEFAGDTNSFEARLADHPLVKGDDIYHIVAKVHFAGGGSTTIVVFTHGCETFGFMYGGTNLRSLVDANMVERLYRAGKRAPF